MVSGAGVDGFKARTNSSRGFLPSFANLQISILTRSNPHVENVSVSGPGEAMGSPRILLRAPLCRKSGIYWKNWTGIH